MMLRKVVAGSFAASLLLAALAVVITSRATRWLGPEPVATSLGGRNHGGPSEVSTRASAAPRGHERVSQPSSLAGSPDADAPAGTEDRPLDTPPPPQGRSHEPTTAPPTPPRASVDLDSPTLDDPRDFQLRSK